METYKSDPDIVSPRDDQANDHNHPVRSLLILTVSFTLVFTAFLSLEGIQSSINFEAGMGTVSMGLLYACFFTTNLFLGPLIVQLAGPKWTLLGCWIVHTLFICANFYPSWYTMIPVSAMVGVASSPIWIAHGVYLATLSRQHAKASGQSVDVVMGRLGGILGLADALPKGIGSAIMSAVLSPLLTDHVTHTFSNCSQSTFPNNTLDYTLNAQHGHLPVNILKLNESSLPCSNLETSINDSYSSLDVCGPNHCPYLEDHISVLTKPSKHLIYLLCGLFLASNLLGVATVFLLPNIRLKEKDTPNKRKRLLRTMSLFSNRRLYMLMASYMVVGYSNGCFGASFTQSFVSCTMGVGMVGYILMVEGFGRCASFLSGQLVKCIPRIVHTIFALCLVIALSLSWMLWHPSPSQKWVFFTMAAAAGIIIGVMRLHNRVLTAQVFKDCTEAGFAQSLLWDSLGRCVAFVSSSMLCMWVKALMLMCVGLLAIVSQIALEIDQCRQKRNEIVRVSKRDEMGDENDEDYHQPMLEKQNGTLTITFTDDDENTHSFPRTEAQPVMALNGISKHHPKTTKI